MIKSVYDYFEDLDKKKLPRDRHNLIYDGKNITNVPTMTESGILKHPLVIDGTHYYVKGNNGEYSIVDIASANMYNSIGIPTPTIYTVEKPAGGCLTHPLISLATQDVKSVKDILFTVASELIARKDMTGHRLLTMYKWDPLYDANVQKIPLKYMTRECFDQLVGLFLVDELRSERDRHEDNYFFYKSKDADKFEGVLPIDHEMMQVLRFDLHKKDSFGNFLYTPYQTPNMFGSMDNGAYVQRIKDLKELLEDGVLTKEQIDLMKRAIRFNLPKEIKKVGKNPHFKPYKNFAYENTSRLWDYHHKDIGRELGL